MLEKRRENAITKGTTCVDAPAIRRKLIVAVPAVVVVVWAAIHVSRVRTLPAPPPVPPKQETGEILLRTNNESLLGEAPMAGALVPQTGHGVSPPPGGILLGRRSEDDDASDLSTPSAAVYSVLALIDSNATEQLAQCCTNGADRIANGLYPRYLGHPVELVEVVEEDNAAQVTWKATVHTEFSLKGTRRSRGESMILTTRLIRTGGVWKLSRLHE